VSARKTPRHKSQAITTAARAARELTNHFGVTMSDPDPLALIERAQMILAQADAPIATLEEARLDLQRVITVYEREIEEAFALEQASMTSPTPGPGVGQQIGCPQHAKKGDLPLR
jgi:hypothetical protein